MNSKFEKRLDTKSSGGEWQSVTKKQMDEFLESLEASGLIRKTGDYRFVEGWGLDAVYTFTEFGRAAFKSGNLRDVLDHPETQETEDRPLGSD